MFIAFNLQETVNQMGKSRSGRAWVWICMTCYFPNVEQFCRASFDYVANVCGSALNEKLNKHFDTDDADECNHQDKNAKPFFQVLGTQADGQATTDLPTDKDRDSQ